MITANTFRLDGKLALIKHTPSRRWGDVEDLAPAAVFLASDAARIVNGHILYVDGGITATL
jgi:gluconate 5-dehydrogenase